ncbi:MAG: carbon monoxide dehydrogenase [Chloroflexi bacterium]|jgi:molybdenum cofactor cytidylyltransferase|nr:carbon monoxide dehydrogenase [Chloroflexota bacterium]MEA2615326.1 molybdenum cofactor cytidylyltransferase [Chloroflexota bacterium]
MRTAGVVLAAGASRRMGRPKQLLPLAGTTLLGTALAAARGARLDELVLVLGADAERIGAAVDTRGVRVVVAADHAEGMGASLRTGVAALGPEIERVAILLGDQPRVGAALVDAVLDRHRRSGLPAAAARSGGVLQPPVVADRRLWPQLLAARGDTGLRALLRAVPGMVATLSVEDAALDVDTPDDYRRLLAEPEVPVAGRDGDPALAGD